MASVREHSHLGFPQDLRHRTARCMPFLAIARSLGGVVQEQEVLGNLKGLGKNYLLGEDGGVLGPLGTPIQLEPPDKDLVTPDANVLRWRKVMYP